MFTQIFFFFCGITWKVQKLQKNSGSWFGFPTFWLDSGCRVSQRSNSPPVCLSPCHAPSKKTQATVHHDSHQQTDEQGKPCRMSSRRDSQHGTACLECVCVCVCVYMCACDALSIERVVICKSALPWAGGVKLGEQEREGETDDQKDRQRVNDRDECEREGGEKKKKPCESGLYYITGFVQSPVNNEMCLHVHTHDGE